jgi:hypothetical protein
MVCSVVLRNSEQFGCRNVVRRRISALRDAPADWSRRHSMLGLTV